MIIKGIGAYAGEKKVTFRITAATMIETKFSSAEGLK